MYCGPPTSLQALSGPASKKVQKCCVAHLKVECLVLEVPMLVPPADQLGHLDAGGGGLVGQGVTVWYPVGKEGGMSQVGSRVVSQGTS